MAVFSPAPRINGWLILPLAWLIVTLLSSALMTAMYLRIVFMPVLRHLMFSDTSALVLPWLLSLATALLVCLYSAWVTWIFCRRSRRLPRHYIIWTLLSVLLALKTFAFTPVTDGMAMRTLLIALLAAVLLVPYFKRSKRVKATFIAP